MLMTTQLPDVFKDFVMEHMGWGPSKNLITHVCWEIMHVQWAILLDDEFLEAYAHGIVLECSDGIKRRFYHRIFTYSTDYPEKLVALHFYLLLLLIHLIDFRVLLASICGKGRCPCPHCLMPLAKVHNLGTVSDMNQRQNLECIDNPSCRDKVKKARSVIYEQDYTMNNRASEELLKDQSLVATEASI